MSDYPSILDLEQEAVEAIVAAELPGLVRFAIESLSGQVDLENDQLAVSKPTLLVAVVGASHQGGNVRADVVDMAFVAVVPGLDQAVRRQDALQALREVRAWMDDEDTPYAPQSTRTERLHPVCVAALFAQRIG